ncbi:IS3 family transposase [Sporosarcina pasteurii]|uniref:IS3 family transposase n=1 Tax=Sporosarcina pasteurii TaxID=1474 RepID=UPI001FBAF240|nr:IS3 family transposase [Sporosarcina pasteurii]
MQGLYDKSGGTYGAKRIAGKLKVSGHVINHKRVARLMKELNIKSVIRIAKRTKIEKEQGAGYVYPNFLERHFDASLASQKWVTDISELVVNNVKLFISAIMDLHNREIISIVISYSPNMDFIEKTIRTAMQARGLADMKQIVSVYRSFRHHCLI